MGTEEETLYDRIGGFEAVRDLVDAFYARVREDESLAPFFKHTSMEKLLKMQTEFFAAALGGPIDYSGMELSHVHHGRGIERAHFQRFVEILLETLEVKGVSDRDASSIIDRVSTYSGNILSEKGEDG